MPYAGHEDRHRNVAISISIDQTAHTVDEQQFRQAIADIVHDSPFVSAVISVAVVDDATIHDLNRRFLQHDYPTDVLSFVLEDDGSHLEGEIVISADTAARVADELDWSCAAEQLLYVIHGTLHLVGFSDTTPAEAADMRTAEARYLLRLGYERRESAAAYETMDARDDMGREGAATC
jgi:probable rRNA maturation factor